MPNSKKKKRGRKNLGLILNYKEEDITEPSICSEEEPIIVHLPISINDLNVSDSDNISEVQSSNIFIKSESEINNVKKSKKDKIIKGLQDEIKILKKKLNLIEIEQNKTDVSYSNYSKSTKCWWCRNNFDTPAISLPEDYFLEKFICIGHFCSFNCAMSYNLEINDQKTWKRKSLLSLLYQKTYSKFKEINPAPSWRVLKEYGGSLTIEEFRENFIINNMEYLYLHPPLITRFSSIEKTYNKQNIQDVYINQVSGFLKSEYTLKRTKPLKSSRYSLEDTMGLKRKKKKKRKNLQV